MDDNRASAADNLRKISPSCVGSEKFSPLLSLRKIQFSSLSLRSANENYYLLRDVSPSQGLLLRFEVQVWRLKKPLRSEGLRGRNVSQQSQFPVFVWLSETFLSLNFLITKQKIVEGLTLYSPQTTDTPEWGLWGSWSSCNCFGKRVRSRPCIVGRNFADCSTLSGKSSTEEKCSFPSCGKYFTQTAIGVKCLSAQVTYLPFFNRLNEKCVLCATQMQSHTVDVS